MIQVRDLGLKKGIDLSAEGSTVLFLVIYKLFIVNYIGQEH